jgi:hypothetical protein
MVIVGIGGEFLQGFFNVICCYAPRGFQNAPRQLEQEVRRMKTAQPQFGVSFL